MKKKEDGALCIYYQNMNGVKCMEELYKYMSLMNKYGVGIFGWTETNVNWTPLLINKTEQMERKLWRNLKLIISCSNNPSERVQRGGTCIGIVNNMVGRKATGGEYKT
eukprot:8361483-Ditylum_brightwellii.AAC.1